MNTSCNNATIEYVRLEVADHVSDEQLEKAAADLVYWSSPQAAARTAENTNSSEALLEYF